jgi:hypothetical protein
MKTIVCLAAVGLLLGGCAAAAVVPGAALVDGIVQAEREKPSHIGQAVAWACDKIGGTYTPAGDCEKTF